MSEMSPGQKPDSQQEAPRPPARDTVIRRERIFNMAGVVLAIIALCAGIHLVRAFFLTGEQDFALILRLAFIPIRYTGGFSFDIWSFASPLTYSLLHGGWAHLLVNCVWLAAFGSPLANRIGTQRFLLFWAATALGAVALHFALYPQSPTPLVGASGAISGMMGAAARFAFRVDRTMDRPAFAGPVLGIGEVLRSRSALTFLIVWLVVNLAVGLGAGSPAGGQVAWEAHIGGLFVGFFAIRLFDRRPTQFQRGTSN